jgi:hypothetical protein
MMTQQPKMEQSIFQFETFYTEPKAGTDQQSE